MTVSRSRTTIELVIFFALAFGVAWGGFALLIFQGPLMTRLFGPFGYTSPLFFLIVFSPSLAGFLLTAVFDGRRGVLAMLGALFRPARLGWWAASILALPAAYLAVAFLFQAAGLGPAVDLSKWWQAWPALLFASPYLASDPGPVGEEFGWRGFAQPRMLALLGTFPAGLILGLIWGIWHLPVFFAQGMSNHSELSIPLFIACTPAFSIFSTWLYVRANRNLLLSGIIPHIVLNSTGIVGMVAFASPAMTIAAWGLVAALLLFDLARSGAAARIDWFSWRGAAALGHDEPVEARA